MSSQAKPGRPQPACLALGRRAQPQEAKSQSRPGYGASRT